MATGWYFCDIYLLPGTTPQLTGSAWKKRGRGNKRIREEAQDTEAGGYFRLCVDRFVCNMDWL